MISIQDFAMYSRLFTNGFRMMVCLFLHFITPIRKVRYGRGFCSLFAAPVSRSPLCIPYTPNRSPH